MRQQWDGNASLLKKSRPYVDSYKTPCEMIPSLQLIETITVVAYCSRMVGQFKRYLHGTRLNYS